jgi:5-methylcytosine-specific restriction endonuclease McrA
MKNNEIYLTLLSHPNWYAKREQILKRDNCSCQICGSKLELQVHHRQYHINKKTGQKRMPWEYNNKFLITLCKSCHQAGHKQFEILIFKN